MPEVGLILFLVFIAISLIVAARAAVKSKQKNLGNYKDFDNAVLARLKAERLNGFPANSPAQQYIQKMFL